MSNVSSLNFQELIAKMTERCADGSTSPAVLANLKSALKAFMVNFNLNDSNSVGSWLRASYYKNLKTHVDVLISTGQSSSYIANRKSLLSRWHSLVLQLDAIEAVESNRRSPFQAQLDELVELSKASISEIARAAGISISTLRCWSKGTAPNQRAIPSIKRLERYFALDEGSLLSLAFIGHRASKKCDDTPPPNTYRSQLGAKVRDIYYLASVSIELTQEWKDFVIHKTEKLPELNRYSRGVWAVVDNHTAGESKGNQFWFINGKYVPTAEIAIGRVRAYLGWLNRSKELGGAGLPEAQVQTLAWLNQKQLAHRYLRWTIERSNGKAHGGVLDFLKFIKALNHPVHGYLTQMSSLHSRLPESYQATPWDESCKTTYEWASQTLNSLTANGTEQSREPFKPIMHILELDSPLSAISDMVARMKSCRPATGGQDDAIWARDLLLIKLMASNPLRAKNLKLLTYRGDNTGNLYQRTDGSWYIRIEKRDFKNAKGAARDRDYDMPVQVSVWRDIERYLNSYRSMLPSANHNDYVFLSSESTHAKGDHGVWHALNRRVFKLFQRYLWNCAGVGPHAIRYIVGTAILKKSPGAWDAAAAVLHDEVDTVKAHYAHLRSCDGGAYVHSLLDSVYSRM